MCGRYAINQTGPDLAATYVVDWLGDPPTLPRYNVAPQTEAPVLRTRSNGTRVLDTLRWGLLPPWAGAPRIATRLINARAETAARTPAFREALRERRCIVPASGFYEWTGERGRRVPHYLHPAAATLSMGAIWERGDAVPGVHPLRTFCVLTTPANADVRPLHDRMPLILPAEVHHLWLDPETPEEVYSGLLRPAPPGTLVAHPVSPAVNSVDVDRPELIQPVREEQVPLPL